MPSLRVRFILLSIILLMSVPATTRTTNALSRSPSTSLQQEIAPFLHPPYYGTERVNCVYDHEYPIYDAEDELGNEVISTTVVHYDGTRHPAPCIIGEPSCYSGHNGIDYDMHYEPVLASANGLVDRARWHDPQNHNYALGLYVRIDHENDYWTIYGHLSIVSVDEDTEIEDALSTRRVIGISGNTGNSTGTHLHLEVEPGDHLL